MKLALARAMLMNADILLLGEAATRAAFVPPPPVLLSLAPTPCPAHWLPAPTLAPSPLPNPQMSPPTTWTSPTWPGWWST